MSLSQNFILDENKDWKEALNYIYSDFNNIVEMSEDAYNHFLCCVPPKIIVRDGYVCGEPYSHTSTGQGIYLTAIHRVGKYYAQMGTVSQFINLKLFKF